MAYDALTKTAQETLEAWYPEKFKEMTGRESGKQRPHLGLAEEADALEAQITDEIRQDPEYVPMDEPRREQNFQRWFGESKVTDRQGNPKVMYHGSPQAGFETFDIWGSKFGLFGQGSYFTENPERGSSYAESRRRRSGPRTPGVYGVYLSINNPLDMDAPADVNEWRAAFEDQMDWAEVQEELPAAREMHELTEDDDTTNAAIFLAIRTAMVRQSHQEGIPRYEAEEIIMGGMMGMGYDGVKHVGGRYTRAGQASGISHDVWIAWDPRQIKAATGNRGTFDPEDPSILREEVEDFDAEGPATMAPTTFDVSKIIPELVNEDGTLIPVYHGTDQVVKAGMDQWGDLKPPPAKGPKAGEGGFKKFRKHARGTWVTTNPKAASEYGMSAGNNAMDRMGGGESWDAEKVFGRPIKELEEEGIVEKSWRGYSWENPTAGRVAPLYANIKQVWRVPKDVEDDFYHRKSEGGRFPSQAASEKWAIEQAINAGADAIDHGGGTYQIVDPKILESAMSPGQKGGLYEDVTPLEADAKVSPQRRLFQSRARRFGSRKMGGIKRSEYFKTVAPQIRQIYIDKEMEDAPGTSQAQKRGQIDPRLKGNLNDGKIKQRMYEYLLEKGEQEDSDRYQDAIEVEAESWFLSGNRVPGIFTNLTPEQVLEIVRVEAGDELFTREVAERVSEQLKRMRPPREGEVLLKTGHVETQLAHLIDRHDGKPPVDELRKVAGAPVKGKTKRTDGMFTRSIEDIKDRVIRGWQEMPGQYRWYNDFGAGAKSLVGDPNMIEFSGVFAITSAQQPPRGNLTDTLHLMATAREFFSQRHGYDGQSPLDVSGLDAEKTIEALTKYFVRKKIRPDGLKIFSNENQLSRIAKFYVTGVFDGGTKTGTYALNTFYRANSTFFPFTVNDVHVARGFGFVRKDIAKNKEGKRLRNEDGSVKYVENPMFATDDEYRYAQYVLSHVANDLGISPDQAQAAFWFYVKTHEAPSKDIDTDTGQGDGTYEDAAQFSQPEIDALTPLIDLGSPLTNRFTSESIRVDGSRGYQVSHAEVQELEELSRARGTRIAAALKPGKLGVTDVSFYTDDNRQPVPMSDLRDFYDDVERGIVNPETGKIKALELLGIDHDYEGIEGSWEGREPSMFIRLPYSDDRQAEFVASLFGDAFDQQAMAIDNPKLYSPEETDAIVGAERKKLVAGVVFTKEDGSAFTDEEMAAIDNAIDPKDIPDYGPYEGQHYSLLNGRRELKLLNFTKWTEEGEYDLAEAMRSAPQFIQDSSPKVIGAINARVQGKGYIFRSYLREAGAGMGPVGGEESSAGYARGLQEGRHYLRRRPDGPDVHQGLIDNLYGPYASSLRRFIDQRGWDTDLLTDERDPTTGPVRSTRLQQVFDTVDQPGDTAPDPEGRLTRLAEEVDDFETGAPAPPEFDTINYAPSEVLSSVRVQLDKRSLDRVVKSLQQTYEGQQVVADEAPFNARAAELGRDPTTLSGFVDQENNTIYINPAAAKADTPIHQFGHIWIQRLQEQDASLYNAGIELVRQSPYYERASKAGYGAFAEEEALVQLIGERGADIVEAEGATRRQQGLVQRILDRVGEIVQKLFGKRVGLDVTDMTLGDFVDVAARAVLENKPITTGQGVRGGDTRYRQRRSEQDRLSFGGKLFHEPVVETKAIAEEYVRESGIGRVVDRRITRVAAAQGKAIGDAYEAMAHSPERPEVMEAYQAMATETVAQYETILRHGYQVELWQGDGEPYVNSPAMMEDVRNNKHMFIFSTEEGYGEDAITDEERRINPLLADSGYKDVNGRRLLVNDVFRFVHDFFGHTKRGNGFGAIGEENAWDAHSQMYSDAARRAMTSETRGQNSWVNFGPHLRKPSGRLPLPGDPKYIKPPDRPFADQKNALLPDEIVFPERNRSRVLMEEVDDFEAGDVSGRARSIFNQIFGQAPPAAAPPPSAPAPDVPPPAPEPAPGAEERRFPQSLERAGRVAPQDDSRYYIPQSNLETRRIVEQTFNKEGLAGLLRMVGDENQPPSAERTAAGIWLHAYYMDEANRKRGEGNNEEADAALERAVDVASTVSERLTRSGQEVQAASMIGLLSPESVGIYAQRRIDKINEKHGLGRKRIILKTKEKRTLTEKAYSRMKALALKAEALQQVGADAEALTSAMDDLVEQKTLTPEQVAQIDNFRNRYRQTLEGEPVDPADEGVRTKQEPQMGWRAILRNKVRTKAQGARERLREQGRLRAGIPVDEMADLVLVGVDKMAELGEGFRSWQQAMQSELAEDISAADMHKIYDQSLEAYKQDKKEARREFAQLKKIDEFIEKVAADPPLQDSRDVAELIEAIRTMKVANEDARVAIGQEVELMLKRLEPRAWTEYLTTILHIGRLLAPKTAGRNIIGNQLAWYAERAAMMTAATIDRGISAATGRDREIIYTPAQSNVFGARDFIRGVAASGSLVEGLKQATPELREGFRAGYRGISPRGLPTAADLPQGLTFDPLSEDIQRRGGVAQGAFQAARVLEGVMSAQLKGFDFAAYMRAYNTVLQEQAVIALRKEGVKFDDEAGRDAWISNWLSKTDPKIQKLADDYARYVTFQDDTVLANVGRFIKNLANLDRDFFGRIAGEDFAKRLPWKSMMFGEFLLAYPRVPANLINRGLAYSPAGILKSAIQFKRAAQEIETGSYREGVMALSRALVGSGGGALVWHLAKLGLMSGEEEEDWDIVDLKKQTTGEAKYRINVTGLLRYIEGGFNDAEAKKKKGDKLVSYDWAQPLAISAAFAINMQQAMDVRLRKDARRGVGGMASEGFRLAQAGARGAYSIIEEQPMLTGMKDLFKSYGKSDGLMDGMVRVLSNVPAGFVPQIVNQVRQVTDNTSRVAFVPDNPAQTAVNKLINRLPFVSETLPKMYKTLGAEMPKEIYAQGRNDIFSVFFSPAFVSEYNPDPVALMLLEPYETAGETGQIPRQQKARIAIGGIKINLTPEDRAQMQRVMAAHVTRNMERFRKTGVRYTESGKRVRAKRTPDEQLKAMKAIVELSGTAAKDWFILNRIDQYKGEDDEKATKVYAKQKREARKRKRALTK